MIRKTSAFKNIFYILILLLSLSFLSACASTEQKVKLDPKNPVSITVWHYYNGLQMNAMDELVAQFNETVGREKGIIVENYGHGSVPELERAVMSSAKKEIGSQPMPNIFASYADTAYEAEKLGLLANLDDYITKEEQGEYLDSYIEEGRIGLNGELRIFPVAKSSEVLFVNETDWLPFANACGVTYEDMATIEGLAQVAQKYYEWTDAKTPDTPDDGDAFFGRDSMANLFIIGSKEFGIEIFHVVGGKAEINLDKAVLRKIWDNYYVPYISGYFYSYGKFRSDDAKVGDILAYIGSTTSASYFPQEVNHNGKNYPITSKALPVPHFEGAEKVLVQQGAGMVVSKTTPEEEYASVEFMKWFTDTQVNLEFASQSGYLPVKKKANDFELLSKTMAEKSTNTKPLVEETFRITLSEIKVCQLYTNKAFTGGAQARSILDNSLQNIAVADREAVLAEIAGGASHQEAVAKFNTDENFNNWADKMTADLVEAAK